MKKSILFILPSFNIGGTVFSTLNMIRMLDKRKYEISVFAMSHCGPIKEQYEGIEILPENILLSSLFTKFGQVKGCWRKTVSIALRLTSKMFSIVGINLECVVMKCVANSISSKKQFDIVASCQEDSSTIMASYFSKSKRIAWVRCEYTSLFKVISEKSKALRARIYPQFDNIVCVSSTTRNDFVSYYPQLESKVLAIHNIQETQIIIDKSKAQIDDEFPSDCFNILSVGRIAHVKRYSYIPEIASRIINNGAKFKWYIIGDGNEGGEYDALLENIRKYEMQDYVICLGSRVNPYPYILSADLTVVPSSFEACPRVVIESKILHTPVVCADFNSAKEFIENGVDGYIDTIDNIWKPISDLINNKSLYDGIKTKCDEFVFDNDGIMSQLNELFNLKRCTK